MTVHTYALRTGVFGALRWGPSDGPAVLCLHGFPDVPYSYAPLAEALAAQGFSVTAPFLRGYAPSTPEGPFHIAKLADDLVAWLEYLSPSQPARVIGHDWGAVSLYAALEQAPEKIQRAVVLSVPHPAVFLGRVLTYPGQARRSWYMGFFQLGSYADRAVMRNDFAFIDRLWRDWSPGYTLPAEEMRRLKDCLRQSMPGPVDFYRAMLRHPGVALRLLRASSQRKIEVPTLYLHGEQDGCIAGGLATGQARYFANCLREESIPQAGHFMLNEQPGPVSARILDFFSSPRVF
jgi:pimeloyl-ACP methyl ester carboxylesterase